MKDTKTEFVSSQKLDVNKMVHSGKKKKTVKMFEQQMLLYRKNFLTLIYLHFSVHIVSDKLGEKTCLCLESHNLVLLPKHTSSKCIHFLIDFKRATIVSIILENMSSSSWGKIRWRIWLTLNQWGSHKCLHFEQLNARDDGNDDEDDDECLLLYIECICMKSEVSICFQILELPWWR